LPLALVYWLVMPLLALLVALPFTLVRSVFSRRRWIEAETRGPAPILVRWRTTSARAEKAVERGAAGIDLADHGVRIDLHAVEV